MFVIKQGDFYHANGLKLTPLLSYARKFKTMKAAEAFLSKYAGTGYGVCPEYCTILDVARL